MTPPSDEGRVAAVARGSSLPVPVAIPARVWPTLAPRHAAFLLLIGLSAALLWQPFSTVMVLSLRRGVYEHYSHIVLVPLISVGLIFLSRAETFARVDYAAGRGGLLMMVGIALSWVAWTGPVADPEQPFMSLAMLALVVLCAGAFLLCYGMAALRVAGFPLAFLLFMVPLPPVLLHSVIVLLQKASAEMTYVIFNLLGVPIYREGFVFALPGLAIEVAEECSGIRSSLALAITSLLMAHLQLRTAWARTLLVTAVFPIAVVKNAVRIVVLSLLAIHVDKGFITDSVLHRYGGIPLFAVTVLVVGSLVCALRRIEGRRGGRVTAG